MGVFGFWRFFCLYFSESSDDGAEIGMDDAEFAVYLQTLEYQQAGVHEVGSLKTTSSYLQGVSGRSRQWQPFPMPLPHAHLQFEEAPVSDGTEDEQLARAIQEVPINTCRHIFIS